MEENDMLQDHEKRISNLEENHSDIVERVENVTKEVTKGTAITEKDNQILREQNNLMLEKLVGINDKVHERKHELKLIDKNNFWKFVLAIVSGSGLVYGIIQLLIQAFK